ncbi:hypothetical protein KKE45_03585 [Patescibacteria group bacterium]|nr:hypothetical protein [Patescibacteria group bacterium]
MSVLGWVLKILSVFLFLYLVWRVLKEDYEEMRVVEFSWLCILFFFLGGRIFYGFLNWGVWNESIWEWFSFIERSGFSYIGAYLFVLLFVFVFCWRVDWKIWNVLEDVTLPLLSYLLLFLLSGYLLVVNNQTFFYLLSLLLTFVLILLLGKRYRSFYWYKSGKSGFLFFFANMIEALSVLILIILGKLSRNLLVLALVFFLISLIGLFILGEVMSGLLVFKRRKSDKKEER